MTRSLRSLLRRRQYRRLGLEYTRVPLRAANAARRTARFGVRPPTPSLLAEQSGARIGSSSAAGESRMRSARRLFGLAVAVGASLLCVPLSAHHSTAEYDAAQIVEARGEV